MLPSPYPADDLAKARAALTDAGRMDALDFSRRCELVASAFAVLHGDRVARLGPHPVPAGPPRVICIPRAVFEAGRPTPRRRPRLIVMPQGPTPGDAA